MLIIYNWQKDAVNLKEAYIMNTFIFIEPIHFM
jgi:hypothetical protein